MKTRMVCRRATICIWTREATSKFWLLINCSDEHALAKFSAFDQSDWPIAVLAELWKLFLQIHDSAGCGRCRCLRRLLVLQVIPLQSVDVQLAQCEAVTHTGSHGPLKSLLARLAQVKLFGGAVGQARLDLGLFELAFYEHGLVVSGGALLIGDLL